MSSKKKGSASTSTSHTNQGSTAMVKQGQNSAGGTSSSGTTSTGSKTTGGTYYSGEYAGGSYTFASQKPKKVFLLDGMEFWGSSKTNLEDLLMDDNDLIVNCSGYEYTHNSFVRTQPEWMKLELSAETKPHQLVLDWKDYSPPPKSCELDFWKAILNQAKEHGIKRVICCCTGGQGRTGTALASLILASEKVTDPDVVIDFIREQYTSKAIESKSQENYLWGLVCGQQEVFGGVTSAATSSYQETEGPPPPPKTCDTSGVSSQDADDEWAEWVREWGYDQDVVK